MGVAYYTDSHAWVGGRDKLRYPTACNPTEYRTFTAPPCRAVKPMEYACNSGFRDAACIPDGRGNMGGTPVECIGEAFDKIDVSRTNECSATCKANVDCQAFQI